MARYSAQTPIIDYEYTNYDVKKAQDAYRAVCDEIASLQTALDEANTTGLIDIIL